MLRIWCWGLRFAPSGLRAEPHRRAGQGPGDALDRLDLVDELPGRIEAAHRCGREARRQDRGGRGHHLDPDLPGGAALPAARSGRTADPNTRSEASISRISRLRGESEFPRPTGTSLNGAQTFSRDDRAHTPSVATVPG